MAEAWLGIVVARRMHQILGGQGISVAGSLVGSYVTRLDMHGVSITLTAADDDILTAVDGDILSAWHAPVRTPTLTWREKKP